MDKEAIRRSVMLAVAQNLRESGQGLFVPAAVSGRHVHLCAADIEALFGKGHKLVKLRDLVQPDQYACEEKVTLACQKGRIENIRVLGPARPQTQVEISLTDCHKVGIKPVVRMSGDSGGTSGGRLIGPAGEVTLQSGVIVSARHLHISVAQAALYGLSGGDVVSVKKGGEREAVFGNVLVRAGDAHELELHIDTDEANAAGLLCGELLELYKQGQR